MRPQRLIVGPRKYKELQKLFGEREMKTIQEIEEFIIQAGSDHLRTFGGKLEGGANIQQVPSEISRCIHTILSMGYPIKNYLEIGSASGGSAFLINHFFKPEKIVLVDDNRHPKAKLRQEILKDVERVEIIGDSHSDEVISKVYGLDLEFDLIHIDGDHSYSGALKDIINYIPLVTQGLIMMHDIKCKACFGVEKLFQELKAFDNLTCIGEFVADAEPICGIGLLHKNLTFL
jgi:predicted O-methyltransferase YrrM